MREASSLFHPYSFPTSYLLDPYLIPTLSLHHPYNIPTSSLPDLDMPNALKDEKSKVWTVHLTNQLTSAFIELPCNEKLKTKNTFGFILLRKIKSYFCVTIQKEHTKIKSSHSYATCTLISFLSNGWYCRIFGQA